MCGENYEWILWDQAILGIPPRVWGKLVYVQHVDLRSRNTPTCVGKTGVPEGVLVNVKEYPHVCGENSGEERAVAETIRNTPTCVGKTGELILADECGQEYPHVCGENAVAASAVVVPAGIPPRVWGKRTTRFH